MRSITFIRVVLSIDKAVTILTLSHWTIHADADADAHADADADADADVDYEQAGRLKS